MEKAPKKYNDPYWVNLAKFAENKEGLPEGMLQSILLYGEKSNADQVSSAGARTPFQIIPATRDAALKKYGIDAYLNPFNAAIVAAKLSKDSLNRNNGDIPSAVGEYIAGTDRKNWGSQTMSYIDRVTNSPLLSVNKNKNSGGDSWFDTALNEVNQALPNNPQNQKIRRLYESYKNGEMAPEDAKQFESDVNSGLVMLPSDIMNTLQPKDDSSGTNLPESVIKAYNSGEMSREDKIQLEEDIRNGLVAQPKNLNLQNLYLYENL